MGTFRRLITILTFVIYMVTESSSFCVINQSCQATIHAEIWNRRLQSLFPDGFKANVPQGIDKAACCAVTSSGCNYPNDGSGDILMWIDCGNGGQSVVACATCDIIVNENNMIMVQDQGKSVSFYACRS